jgi:hypothetical protein
LEGLLFGGIWQNLKENLGFLKELNFRFLGGFWTIDFIEILPKPFIIRCKFSN